MTKYTPEDIVNHEGIGVILKNDMNEILIQKHVKYGFWTIPVGKVKKGQTIIEGFKEEMCEELGIVPTHYEQVTDRKYNYMRLKQRITVHCYLFEVKQYTGTLINKEPHKHKTQEFMNLETIKKLPFLSDLTLLYLETIGCKRKARI
jgi:8-oxo-dGTP pyrophosphatase MutT (NUDIX family)